MGALAEQQTRIREARARLGLPAIPTMRVARSVVPAPAELPVEKPILAFRPLVPFRPNRGPHWMAIVREVAVKHNMHPRDMLGVSREKAIILARNEAMWRMRHEIVVTGAPMSYPMIGHRFGKDHSSVIHSVRRHQALISKVSVDCAPFVPILVDGFSEAEHLVDRPSIGKAIQ